MLQLLGCGLILFGSIGMGYSYIEKEQKIITVIQTWEHMMQMFISEITYKKQPLSLACYEIGEKIGRKEGEYLKRIVHRMQDKERSTFEKIWRKEWKNYYKEEKINVEIKKLIEEFGALTGFEDEAIQKKMIEEQLEKWKSMRIKMQQEHGERKRLILLLSSGLGVITVLILW